MAAKYLPPRVPFTRSSWRIANSFYAKVLRKVDEPQIWVLVIIVVSNFCKFTSRITRTLHRLGFEKKRD